MNTETDQEVEQPSNLMDGLLSEMNRVREVAREYRAIPAGFIAASLMELDIRQAERAIASGDVIQMLQAYRKLNETNSEL